MFFIESERLKLLPLTHELLLLLYRSDRSEMENVLGLTPSRMQVDPLYQEEITDALINFWLPQTLDYPDRYEWYTNWEIILKDTNTSIGGIGFAGYPDENGEAEVGYMLDQQHQGLGYAAEALETIVNWAFTNKEVNVVNARTPVDNTPSRKLLEKVGFAERETGEGLVKYQKQR
ncbi:GNAT family N-acetyltransferase [Chitinophaga tropicalis]|uniref:GNAT family N-acetyltransferase n=1 Tax=Chitinophaga tropicalis TaxID=2683588 RepID=A0A7K1TXW0_9BACT|nr:GNAT family N-acetyltransferase [Chitinophaga tropicalis]MVT06625.1 GNAT family N-acetyltransferase [Chitinophaga tropicalis]